MLMNQYFVSLLSKVMVVGQGVPLCQYLCTDATQHKMVMPRMVAQMAICFIAPPPHSLSYLKGWNVKVSVTSCALINLIGRADGGGGMASRWNALTDGRKDGRREEGRRTDEDEVRGRVGI